MGLAPVSKTAYYCCGVRMQDARHPQSLVGDVYAQRFMDEAGQDIFRPFARDAMPNLANAVRCRIIDDHLRWDLSQHPDAQVVCLGSGFDSRPYRLEGGRWFELDAPQILDLKQVHLPVEEAPNPLRRIPVRFGEEALADRLSSIPDDRPTLVVVEGVFMYLDEAQTTATLQALAARFPRHVLYCETLDRAFFERFGGRIHGKLGALGARFTERPVRPEAFFLQYGYRQEASKPVYEWALETGAVQTFGRIPKPLFWLALNVFARALQGYRVHRFVRD